MPFGFQQEADSRIIAMMVNKLLVIEDSDLHPSQMTYTWEKASSGDRGDHLA